MITIEISEETNTREQMAECLRYIAKLIEDGYYRGYYPTWATTGEEETEEETEEDIDE